MPSPAGFPAGEGRKRGGIILIVLRKMNNERFLVNHNQMMNHDYYLVKDTVEEIIQKIADYNAKVQDIHREISVLDRRS